MDDFSRIFRSVPELRMKFLQNLTLFEVEPAKTDFPNLIFAEWILCNSFFTYGIESNPCVRHSLNINTRDILKSFLPYS